MSLVDMINWAFEYLDKNQFKDNTIDKIKLDYIDYCKANNIEIEAGNGIEIDLRACLSKLESDGYVYSLNFGEAERDTQYRVKMTTLLGKPKYTERTQEEIDNENYARQRDIEIEREIKREKRLNIIKGILAWLWEVLVKYWYALIIPIVVLFIWEIWLKPWINS